MSSIFNMDNGFFSFLGKLWDVIILSIIWLIICIPIVTIGPANTALYYATVKVIRRERGYLFREFFRSFRLNFVKGAGLGIMFTIIFFILGFDILMSYTSTGTGEHSSLLFGVYVALTFIAACISSYVFPILSRFDMKFKQILKLAVFMSVKHLLTTIGMVLITAAGIVAVYYFFILIFIVPALVTLANSLLLERVLKKYMPKSDGPGEDTGKDEWYLE